MLFESMTSLASPSTPGVSFDVAYFDDRFVISCEVQTPYGMKPAVFSLLFNHPLQFDPEKIGFSALTYSGATSYASTSLCHIPNFDSRKAWDAPESLWRSPSNVYRVSELGAEQRFRFHAIAAPNMTCIILSYDASNSVLTLRTHVGILPFAHGLQLDDIVNISTARPGDALVPTEEGWTEQSIEPCPLEDAFGRQAIVCENVEFGSDPVTACTLSLRVRPTPQLTECVGMSVSVLRTLQPFNICTDVLPKSLTSEHTGLDIGATQYGTHGSVKSPTMMRQLPPFDAPKVHNLDPPSYVLIYLDEGKRGTLLQHAYGNSTTTPLAKMVLTPLFRDERMLPRDTTILSGESLTRFTIRFTNPNGSEYNFKGAHISLSLNLIKTDD